ncbi:MAG: hypothetical protein JO263_00415, partial [Candidatus Eremiobacteraeota bacterium]|nr:hypothetical protein [Candidatus Eremiobacteraeota bacterium]
QIVYLGASWAYWDSLGDDSVCGQLEAHLDRAHRFLKPVRCHPVRIDAASFPQMESYIATYLQSRYDLLVINMNLAEAYSIFPNSAPPSTEAGAAALKEQVAKLMSQLSAAHTKLLFVWAYDPEDLSDVENLMERQDNPGRRYFPSSLRDNHDKGTVVMMNAVRPLGVFQYDTYDDFQRYERERAVPPLYGSDDSHMTPRGTALVAELLARYIESERRI